MYLFILVTIISLTSVSGTGSTTCTTSDCAALAAGNTTCNNYNDGEILLERTIDVGKPKTGVYTFRNPTAICTTNATLVSNKAVDPTTNADLTRLTGQGSQPHTVFDIDKTTTTETVSFKI